MGFSFPHTPDKFTATEKTILEYMSSHRDEFLFLTIGQLSAALNISEATVSRFARHVGCEDFKHLKQVVMEQTVQKGAAQKLSNTLRSGSGELLRHCMDQQQFNLQKTLELLDQKEFDRAVQAMLAARRIFIHAKNASRSLAQLLEFRLRRIGLDVHTIPAGGSEVLEGLIPIQRDDLVILFCFSKVSLKAGRSWTTEKRPALPRCCLPRGFIPKRSLRRTSVCSFTAERKMSITP